MAGSSPAMTMLGISWCLGVLVVKIRGYPAKPGHDGTLPIGLISSEEDKAMSATNGGHNVGGVIYPQPFKIRRLGHFGFNVGNLDASVDFYTRLFGFRLTDEIDIGAFEFMREAAKKMKETRIFFLTHGTDHHAFLLADKTMGAFLGDDRSERSMKWSGPTTISAPATSRCAAPAATCRAATGIAISAIPTATRSSFI